MVTSNISNIISAYETVFTKSERKLYLYLQDHIIDIIYMSVTELADIIGVGEATILRFCRKVGYKGYQDFKLAIAQSQITTTEDNLEGDQSIIEVVADNLIQSIKRSSDLIGLDDLETAVELIEKSKRVYFYGVGSSGVAAMEAKNRFMRIGKKYDAFKDSHFMKMISSISEENDLIIAFTLSGGTKDIVDACSLAKSRGANVIAVTSYLKSPVTKYADLILLTSGKEGPFEGGSLFAKISQLFIIDLLFTKTAKIEIERSKLYMEQTAQSITDKSY